MHVFRSRKTQRHGVSLLEVLVSIGVTSVGLLGVLALIPLGGAQARQGQVAERCPVIGLSALSEIRNRDMLAPTNWIEADGAAPVTGTGPQSFCLDPLYIAGTDGTSKLVFPALGGANMHRLTLWNGMGGAPDTTPVIAKRLSKPLAEAIFRSHDDLQLNVSETDRSLPPGQVWLRTETATEATRRQAQGHMSWMMTVQPNLALGYPADVYKVSVVVFYRRIVEPTLRNEFTAHVTAFPGGGVAGGDIVADFATMGYSTDELREAKIPENTWVLLSGTHTTGQQRVFEWYRVLASDSTTTTERQITLAGPDWDTTKIANTQVTVIPGTMAVYQENMQLEGVSLWRN